MDKQFTRTTAHDTDKTKKYIRNIRMTNIINHESIFFLIVKVVKGFIIILAFQLVNFSFV